MKSYKERIEEEDELSAIKGQILEREIDTFVNRIGNLDDMSPKLWLGLVQLIELRYKLLNKAMA